jgi:WD40 repeat protein
MDQLGDPLPKGALTRLGGLRWRSRECAESITFSPDGRTLAMAGRGAVSLLDISTGKLTRQYDGSQRWPLIAFSSNGDRLACTVTKSIFSGVETIETWDIATDSRVQAYETDSPSWIGWSPQGQLLAAFCEPQTILIRDLETNKVRLFHSPGFTPVCDPRAACSCSQDARILAAADTEGMIHVWDMQTGRKRATMRTRSGKVTVMSLSCDGRSLVSVCRAHNHEDVVELWDTDTPESRPIVLDQITDCTAVAFRPDGQMLATAGQNDIRFSDVTTGRTIAGTRYNQYALAAIAFSIDGKTLAGVDGRSSGVRCWDVATCAITSEPFGHGTQPSWIAFSQDGQTIATIGDHCGTIMLWNAQTGALRYTINGSATARSCAFSANGHSIYSAWGNGELRVSDVSTGRQREIVKLYDAEWPRNDQSVLQMCLSRDCTQLIVISHYYSNDKDVLVNDDQVLVTGLDGTTLKKGFSRRRVKYHLGVALSSDARLIAVCEDDNKGRSSDDWGRGPLVIEDIKTGESLRRFPVVAGQTEPLEFSPNNQFLASRSYEQSHNEASIRVWDIVKESEVYVRRTPFNGPVAFSPNGDLFAIVTLDNGIALVDVSHEKDIGYIKGYRAKVIGLAFTPDGKKLVSGLTDNTLLIWDLEPLLKTYIPGDGHVCK